MEYHKPPFRLKELKIELTHECLLKCVHCSSVAEPGCNRTMGVEACREILQDAASMGAKRVAFSGGEPLLWKGLVDAIRLASGLGMAVDLYTTGNVPRARMLLEQLKEAGLGRVMLSVFGADATRHEKVTGVEGSFSVTLSAAARCAGIGLKTEFHFVPLANNFAELPAVARMAQEIGVKQISVLRFVPQGRGACIGDSQLSHEQNLALRKMILELRAEGHNIRLGSPYNFLMLSDRPKCCAGIDRLTVGPDLRIYPCDAFKHISAEAVGEDAVFSSLASWTLAECWDKSPYLLSVRRYLTTPFASRCSACEVLEDCLSGCMAQKFHAHGTLVKCPDPMCLKSSA